MSSALRSAFGRPRTALRVGCTIWVCTVSRLEQVVESACRVSRSAVVGAAERDRFFGLESFVCVQAPAAPPRYHQPSAQNMAVAAQTKLN